MSRIPSRHIHSPRLAFAAAVASTLLLAACGQKASTPAAIQPTGQVDAARLAAVDAEPGAWLTTGRDGGKTHYSPLNTINRDLIKQATSTGKGGFLDTVATSGASAKAKIDTLYVAALARKPSAKGRST